MHLVQVPGDRWRIGVIAGLPAVALVSLLLYGPMPQDQILPNYHQFADQRAFWGIPNFSNVVSNLPFLLVALLGLRAAGSRTAFVEESERTAYWILLAALALIGIGSGYYHAWPDNATLFWDRLPMALAFMAILAATIGERISLRAGALLLIPLLAAGAASVLYWKAWDDLRLYVLVQFYAVLALPLLVALFPPRYSGTAGLVAMIVLYALALAFDRFDRRIGALISTGGHPWKHVAAALAMLSYVITVARRHPVPAKRSL